MLPDQLQLKFAQISMVFDHDADYQQPRGYREQTNTESAPLTVTQLNRQVRSWLEQDLGLVRVLGELSNLSKPASGHLYFTLKDASAQLRCVYFRNQHKASAKSFTDGQQVIAQGKLSLYEARGDYQLIVQDLVQTGLGELYQQFEQLKAKLDQMGLFAAARKRPLPAYPSRIAVVTSSNAAALRDILSTLARRYPLADVCLYPSEVQGKTAASQLIAALKQANADQRCDVIILARGGGSIEDLWPFNSEALAMAISQSALPVVSGVGHETDFTIADFVADRRAATPTAAAEAVTPDQADLLSRLRHISQRLQQATVKMLQYQRLMLSSRMAKLASPEQIVATHWQTLDYLERRLHQQLDARLQHQRHRVQLAEGLLQTHSPNARLTQLQARLQQLEHRLHQRFLSRLQQARQDFVRLTTTLHALSPLATLDRGYAIATHKQRVLFDSKQVAPGDALRLQLARGRLLCRVDTIED